MEKDYTKRFKVVCKQRFYSDNKVDFVATIEFEPTEKHDVKFRASIIQQHKEVENAQLFANYSV